MKVRTAIGRTALRARLTAAGFGALTILGTAAVSACTSSGSPTPSFSSFIGGTSTSASGTGSASAGSTSTPGSTTPVSTPGISTGTSTSATSTSTSATGTPATQTSSASQPASQTSSGSHSPSSSPILTGAPVTGGGGTAGLQDGLLVALGVAAILAGTGSIAYRRRQTRKR